MRTPETGSEQQSSEAKIMQEILPQQLSETADTSSVPTELTPGEGCKKEDTNCFYTKEVIESTFIR
jgi:hypothetical protein